MTNLNPVTGLTVESTQISEGTSTFTTPGDIDSGTFAQRGVVKFFAPGAGVLLIDVGRTVLTTDGSVLVESGRHQLGQYFGGDTSVLEGVCEAVGSPGTAALALNRSVRAAGGQSGIRMGHEGPFFDCGLQHQQPNDRGPQPVNNLSGNQT